MCCHSRWSLYPKETDQLFFWGIAISIDTTIATYSYVQLKVFHNLNLLSSVNFKGVIEAVMMTFLKRYNQPHLFWYLSSEYVFFHYILILKGCDHWYYLVQIIVKKCIYHFEQAANRAIIKANWLANDIH